MTDEQRKKAAEAYVKSFTIRVKESPGKLKGHEKILGLKYKAARDRVDKTSSELEQMRSQIRQAEERAQVMERKLQEDLGRAAAFLESLIDLEMDRQFPAVEKDEGKDEGKTKPVAAA